MILIYIDIILLIILVALTIFSLCFCVYHMKRLQHKGKITILVNQRKVVFSELHQLEDGQLRSVVYQSPVSGVYQELGRHRPRGFTNAGPASPTSPASLAPESPDSGLSDAYEPLHLPDEQIPTAPLVSPTEYNSVTKTRNWNYKEYQI